MILERPVRAEGSVEVWLMSLLQASHESVHCIIRQAFHFINDNQFDFLDFMARFQAQIGILGIQMVWTRDSEAALMQSRSDAVLRPSSVKGSNYLAIVLGHNILIIRS